MKVYLEISGGQPLRFSSRGVSRLENFERTVLAGIIHLVVSNLKVRGSHGKTGDDSGLNYQFVSGYTYPATGGPPPGRGLPTRGDPGVQHLAVRDLQDRQRHRPSATG